MIWLHARLLVLYGSALMFHTGVLRQAIARDLDKRLRAQVDFLTKCRPHSFGTGTAIRYDRQCVAMPSAVHASSTL